MQEEPKKFIFKRTPEEVRLVRNFKQFCFLRSYGVESSGQFLAERSIERES